MTQDVTKRFPLNKDHKTAAISHSSGRPGVGRTELVVADYIKGQQDTWTAPTKTGLGAIKIMMMMTGYKILLVISLAHQAYNPHWDVNAQEANWIFRVGVGCSQVLECPALITGVRCGSLGNRSTGPMWPGGSNSSS